MARARARAREVGDKYMKSSNFLQQNLASSMVRLRIWINVRGSGGGSNPFLVTFFPPLVSKENK